MRVGACMPAYPPFTYSDKTGYDIENWWRVYEIMNGQIRSDAIPAQVAALGSTRPTMEFYPFSTVMAMVENNTLDVGMCGIYALAERSKQFDFAPPYHVSALRVLVPAGNSLTEDDLSLQLVFRSMYYKVSSVAVFSLLSLLYCSMLFAHIFWLVERHTNRSIPRNYGKGVFEGMWLGIVTAATIGYGDITPSTRVGKLVSMAWILWGTLLIAMFSAAITSSLIANEDVVMKEVLKQPLVQSLQDLETSRIGGNFDAAREAILQHFPTSNFSMFGGQTESYEALLRGEADALIEDGASARLLTNKKDSPYAGKFELVQQVALEERQSCIIVSRSGGVSNPLFQPIVYAQLREMNRGGGTPFKALKAVWFGAGNAESPDERLAKSKTVYQDYLTRINLTGGVILGGVLFTWAVSILIQSRKEIQEEYFADGLRSVLSVGRKFTNEELRKKCDTLFDSLDASNGSKGWLDVQEMVEHLKVHGRNITSNQLRVFLGAVPHERGRDGSTHGLHSGDAAGNSADERHSAGTSERSGDFLAHGLMRNLWHSKWHSESQVTERQVTAHEGDASPTRDGHRASRGNAFMSRRMPKSTAPTPNRTDAAAPHDAAAPPPSQPLEPLPSIQPLEPFSSQPLEPLHSPGTPMTERGKFHLAPLARDGEGASLSSSFGGRNTPRDGYATALFGGSGRSSSFSGRDALQRISLSLAAPARVSRERVVRITKSSFFDLVLHLLHGDARVEEETLDDPVTRHQLDHSTDEIRRAVRDMETRLSKMMAEEVAGLTNLSIKHHQMGVLKDPLRDPPRDLPRVLPTAHSFRAAMGPRQAPEEPEMVHASPASLAIQVEGCEAVSNT